MTKREKIAKQMRREARKNEKENKAVNESVNFLHELLTEVYTEEDRKNFTNEDYMNLFLLSAMVGAKAHGLYNGDITVMDKDTKKAELLIR